MMRRSGKLSASELHLWGVLVLWDFENSWVSKSDKGSLRQLYNNINKALQTLNTSYSIHKKIIGYGKIKGSNRYAVSILRSTGEFEMIDVDTKTVKCAKCGDEIRQSGTYPNDDVHERKTDIADIKIVTHMIFHAMKIATGENVPGNILLVSNDKDFKSTVEALTVRGFNVMAAIGDEYNIYDKICGNGTWRWKELEKGGNHISKSILKKT